MFRNGPLSSLSRSPCFLIRNTSDRYSPALRTKSVTVKSLPIVPDGLQTDADTEKMIVTLVNNLASAGRSPAELRNKLGTGLGKVAGHSGLEGPHDRPAVGASTTVAVFLYETHRES